MTSTRACARSSAAARIAWSSNCASASPVSAISVTRKREKCTDTSGKPASILMVTGSSVVLDDGVSMPRRTAIVIAAGLHRVWRREGEGPAEGEPSLRRCVAGTTTDMKETAMATTARTEREQDKTLEDSFPASDPPANSGVTGAEVADRSGGDKPQRKFQPGHRRRIGTQQRPPISGKPTYRRRRNRPGWS